MSDLDAKDESGEEDLLPLTAREVKIIETCRAMDDAVEAQDKEFYDQLDQELSVLIPWWVTYLTYDAHGRPED